MKGDFSRLTYRQPNHYRRVLMQQGRVEIDADGNEQIAIDEHISSTTTTDVIGQAGYPDGSLPDGTPLGGFALGIASGGADLTISQGRMYVDGLLVENDTAGATLLNQPDLPGATIANLGATTNGVYAVYLDAWERLITALDDPLIRETALGGPDTSVRTKLVWQVKLFGVGAAPGQGAPGPTCASVGDPWVAAAASTGTLAASSAAPGSDLPCILPPETGYQSLQNQLYRVEIHAGGNDGVATFKWSRENGSVACLITAPPSTAGSPAPLQVSGPTFHVSGVNSDPSLGLTQGDWVELTDDSADLGIGAGTLYPVKSISPDGQQVTLDTNTTPSVTLARHPKLRRWDQSGTGLTGGVSTVTTAAPVLLENGVQVQFSPGTYHAGDYWLIPARTATSVQQGFVQWPVDNSGQPIQAPPLGITHHYAKLGLVTFAAPGTFGGVGTATTPTDCRLPFPPLTALPGQSDCPCTIVVEPGPGWEQPILNYFQGASSAADMASTTRRDAEICFPVGIFPLSAPLVIANAGNIQINGAGWGTRIVGSGENSPEAALRFQGCTSVTVRDLCATTSRVDSASTNKVRSHINGTLTFTDCQEVVVDGVLLRCGSTPWTLGASCITVGSTVTAANTTSGAGSVRITHSTLFVGEMQVGIQLVHQRRILVDDNEIGHDPQAPSTTLAARLADPGYLAAARSVLLSAMGSPSAARLAGGTPTLAAPTPPAALPPLDVAASSDSPRTEVIRVSPPRAPGTPPTPSTTASPGPSGAAAHLPTISPAVLNVGNQKITIDANSALANTWQAWLDINSPKEFGTVTDAVNYLKKATNTLLTDAAARTGMSEFGKAMQELNSHVPLAARGIVVGGQGLGDLHILDNSISGVLMGISVGVSHRASTNEQAAKQRDPDLMQTIRIAGNVVACAVNDVGAANKGPARFGIFVGNANSLEIEGNRITQTAEKVAAPASDAIRVVGYLGPKTIVRGNHVSNFAMGICIVPLDLSRQGHVLPVQKGQNYLQPISSGHQWLVIDNVIENASSTTPRASARGQQTWPPFASQLTLTPYLEAPSCLQVNNIHVP
ncbi:hypothetical protein FZI85_03440 [Mycobacterium sp. CBMA293]|uniref:DUF6519 domain-containing protein n=1 Tax=unclassified Mycolicibacterium TaxID=2636767 RepID=UPI0012DC3B67|nr:MULTISPECIES: DUF6519 domain-containing protein [unclassified Mycolicibacterium]MUL46989.1 hypothetical protein [Mycolicibacterium sp. CBMA 360]MUL58365.1 hypothetical protein [Mycolicibacterium sp. CBMA 335]MUL73823.1 hypothetical protein [Mycolicibacterium sp. CBMA 311]MUL93248.1 hypothetical protein [Mycolicibacterium sp. CBMA 230]MUM07795.1 hypothetical protein [Mycolicibacterium sp. CBMA 213]